MLHTAAERVTEVLYRHCQLDQSKRAIFVYGAELSLSTCASTVSIILLSILLQDFYSSVAFLLIFYFLRLFAGGYHASTYAKCFLLTNAVYLLTWTFQSLFFHFDFTYLLPLISFASGISIFVLAPIRNKKHPLSDKAYQKNEKIARILVSIETLGSIGLYLLHIPAEYLAMPVLSLAAVAVMMISALLERG